MAIIEIKMVTFDNDDLLISSQLKVAIIFLSWLENLFPVLLVVRCYILQLLKKNRETPSKFRR